MRSSAQPGAARPELTDVPATERLARLGAFIKGGAGGGVVPKARGDLLEPGRAQVLTSGQTTGAVTVTRARLQALLGLALAASDRTPSVVWVRSDDQVAVHASKARVALGVGTLVVGVPVECDQTGSDEVVVAFALGSPGLAAGVLMATPARPDGPAVIVETWGEVFVAAVYRAVLDVVTALAASAGVDRDGRALLPGAVSSDGTVLSVLPQARHAIDRRALL